MVLAGHTEPPGFVPKLAAPQPLSPDSSQLRAAHRSAGTQRTGGHDCLKGKRASWAKLPEAEKGFSTMGMVFGFKLHALVSEAGLFRRWLFAPASCSDVRAGRELTQDLEGDRVLGDKAYVGSDVITPARKNMHDHRRYGSFGIANSPKLPNVTSTPSGSPSRSLSRNAVIPRYSSSLRLPGACLGIAERTNW